MFNTNAKSAIASAFIAFGQVSPSFAIDVPADVPAKIF
jgi:hypothetical protein